MNGRQLTSSLPHFAQPGGLWALVGALRARGCPHILCYSGYTYEQLRRMAVRRPAINHILDDIDILIDGPYVAALASGVDAWRGSSNQRLIYKSSEVAETMTGK